MARTSPPVTGCHAVFPLGSSMSLLSGQQQGSPPPTLSHKHIKHTPRDRSDHSRRAFSKASSGFSVFWISLRIRLQNNTPRTYRSLQSGMCLHCITRVSLCSFLGRRRDRPCWTDDKCRMTSPGLKAGPTQEQGPNSDSAASCRVSRACPNFTHTSLAPTGQDMRKM